MKRKVLLITGASGSGKTTIIRELFKKEPELFCYSISHTTRKKREGEVNGREYHFISKEIFEKNIEKNDFFIEYATFAGNMYGTSILEFQKNDKNKILIVDMEKKGVENIQKSINNGILDIDLFCVLIKIKDLSILKERLIKRGESNLEKRIKWNIEEKEILKTDLVVINDDLETTSNFLLDSIKKHFNVF